MSRKSVSFSEDIEKQSLLSADTLDSEEMLVMRPTKKKKQKKVSGGGMFRYATCFDKCLIITGTLCSFIHGAGMPVLAIVFGGMTNTFLAAETDVPKGVAENLMEAADLEITVNSSVLGGIAADDFSAQVRQFCLYYTYLGVAMLFTSYGQIACWEAACERQVHRIRKSYFKSVLRQEISWYDTHQSGEMTTRLSDDLERVREGTGDKFSLFIQFASAFVAGFVVGFAYNWKLTLVMMSLTPLLAATGAFMAVFIANRTRMEQQKYAIAGAIAEESLSCIRTVLAFNGQKREVARYDVALEDGRKAGLTKYLWMAVGMFFSFLFMFGAYSLAFWYGAVLILEDPSFPRGTVFTVFFAVMSGSFSLGNALPHFNAIAAAKGATKVIFDCIDNLPLIDPYSEAGLKPAEIKGDLEFKYVQFAYPVRKDINVLKGLSFKAEAGQKIAFVGSSGCGKSTIVNLLLRYYDTDRGKITIDGNNISDLNVNFLRNTVGVVSQEPILFDGSLEDNIRLGNPNVTTEQVTEATKLANAYNFISLLPKGLGTRVGERGVQLSGGQKQRIAIARALVRNPKILLLDEATSALDTESESLVQKALEQAQEGRTTLTVAHRLSTIRDCDVIFVLSQGNIVEEGTHQELMDRKGLFYKMVMAQQLDSANYSTTDHETTQDEDGQKEGSVKSSGSSTGSQTFRMRRSTSGKGSDSMGEGDRDYKRRSRTLSIQQDLQRLEREVKVERVRAVPFTKLFDANRKSWGWFALGMIGNLLSGIVMPAFALLYSQIFEVYSEEGDQLKADAAMWSPAFALLGITQGLGFFIAANMLGRAGENITKAMRMKSFANLLRQDATYFDDEAHNTGKICTRFATDAPNVRYVFTRLPMVFSSFFTIAAGIVIAFVFGWKMAFVVVAMVPLIVGSGYFEFKMQFGKQIRDAKLLEEAGKISAEAVENIRTVQALTREPLFFDRYANSLEQPFRQNMRLTHVYGGTFGFSQSVIFFLYAAAFRFGGYLISKGEMTPLDVYRVFFAIAFCAVSFGQISSFIPDIVKARLSAALFFNMIEQKPLIDSCSELGLRPELKGEVQLKNVQFVYPTRPTVRVLQGLSVSVRPGQTLALVGPSGCGKSTVVSLLQRFYDITRGEITFDGYNLKTLNLQHLRFQIGLVSQEPVLFDCTIRENISYGLEGQVNHDDIVQAAKLANIHQFVLTLPAGYDTRVGEKGTQLSGGQKQRIAIARALVRDPKILLLDEATSALDTESEKIVQEALDNARQGRTCIVIAHRLSTIQNADCIAVIRDGKVVEKGTHQELLENKGLYSTLCQMQRLMEE